MYFLMYNLLYHLEIAEDSFITQLKKENEKALE